MQINLQDITLKVCELSKITGSFLLDEINRVNLEVVEVKGLHDYVTYVDKEAEKKLVSGLQYILPAAGFITEENTINTKGEKYNWVIDPLDGTTNYIHGVPMFSISIALIENAKVISGVIYEPNLDEVFFGWKGGNAQLNGKEIKVSNTSFIQNSLWATGFPCYDYYKMDAYIELFKWFMQHSRGIRRLGSAAVDLAYVACGRFDGFYEYGLKPWDVAAGAFLVELAGGKVSDFYGGDDYIFGDSILSTNSLVHSECINAIENHFLI